MVDNKFINNSEKEGDEIDLREILFKYMQHWRWFVVSIFIFTILGGVAYLVLDRKYSVSTAVLLKEEKGGMSGSSGPLGGLQELGLLSTTNNVDNEIAVYSSPNLMKQVVMELGLYTTYFEKGFFRKIEVYNESPVQVKLLDITPDELQGSIELEISFNNQGVDVKGIYTYKKDEIDFKASLASLPGVIELPNNLGRLSVEFRPEVIERNEDSVNEKYVINIQNAQRIAYAYAKEIGVSSTTKQSSVLNINLTVLNVKKGIDFLSTLIKIYNLNNIEDNNEMARNTALFINERLVTISEELKQIEGGVVDYMRVEGISDMGTEAKMFVEQTSEIEQKRINIETQLKIVEQVGSFVQNDNNMMIPDIGITDPGLSKIILEYNTQLLAYDRLVRNTNENSPSRIGAFAELENAKKGIEMAIKNVKNAINISKSEVNRQLVSIASKIRNVPSKDLGLLDKKREQAIKQELYIYLMKVKEETNITMSSKSDKAKVITDPIVPEKPISPKKSVILLASMLLALAVPVGVLFIKDQLEINITSRDDLEDIAIPNVIGELIKKGANEKALVVSSEKTTPIVELFRTLRNNVQFILDSPNKKVILVCSTIPAEGKTFVSANLAASFAITDKKVLLIGMDIRNPKLASDMNLSKGSGLTSYLAGSEPSWSNLVQKSKEYPMLDVLQAGVIPPNPNELLMKPELKQLIEDARKSYDIIIIDSAPVGVVSDTFLISSLVDMTVYVTRENVTPKTAIHFINTMYKEKKLENMYLVINGVDLKKRKSGKGKYGYSQTYGYGKINS